MRMPNHLQQVVTSLWIIVCLLAVLVILGIVQPARAHIEGHPEWNEWFRQQLVPDGSGGICCDYTDVFLLDGDTDVRQGERGPQALIEGVWYEFPNLGVGKTGNAVMNVLDNPTGHTIAWLYNGQPRCFLGDVQT